MSSSLALINDLVALSLGVSGVRVVVFTRRLSLACELLLELGLQELKVFVPRHEHCELILVVAL